MMVLEGHHLEGPTTRKRGRGVPSRGVIGSSGMLSHWFIHLRCEVLEYHIMRCRDTLRGPLSHSVVRGVAGNTSPHTMMHIPHCTPLKGAHYVWEVLRDPRDPTTRWWDPLDHGQIPR